MMIKFSNPKTTKQALLPLLFLIIGNLVQSQTVYPLWEGEQTPYYKENNLKEYQKEIWGTLCHFNITEPTLTVYKAKGENTGKAVIIFPGGGYTLVAMHHEGYDVAEALSAQGITAAVLKYRLPNPESSTQPHLVPITDARKSLKLLRSMADEYGFDTTKVGVLGFSAGSHLATVASLWKSEVQEENPDFSALIYGVTNFSDANRQWLEKELYHREMTQEEIVRNNLLNLVSKQTPPAFLIHTNDDDICRVEETTLYANKLNEHNVLNEVHVFSKGGHGFGLGRKEDGTDQWIHLFTNWLKSNKL
ncbi:alpha/beta hydrolase [Flagellimonas myxillae]|uniref:alpha/beta hydrolase n=1 Tax=Flagellimonas myxillae TaxID=2942214 RepID=UPI00201E8C86|nr:alpha/beta hydrolase [Muricauda myxillae]MCL6265740.1 alpha/beta hydrolase [Muricauda myxillae]